MSVYYARPNAEKRTETTGFVVTFATRGLVVMKTVEMSYQYMSRKSVLEKNKINVLLL